jgi:hypothetical protein
MLSKSFGSFGQLCLMFLSCFNHHESSNQGKKILARFFLADQIFEGVQQKKGLQDPFISLSGAFSMVQPIQAQLESFGNLLCFVSTKNSFGKLPTKHCYNILRLKKLVTSFMSTTVNCQIKRHQLTG